VSTTAVARTQLSPEKLIAAKEVEWQKTIIVIKTIEVSTFLIAMNRVVGRIDIYDDLFRRFVVRFDKQFDKDFGEFCEFFFCDSIFETRKGGSGTEWLVFVDMIFDGCEKCRVFS